MFILNILNFFDSFILILCSFWYYLTFICIPFPLYNRQNFWFLPCIFALLFRFTIFWRVSDFEYLNLSVFPTGCYTAFSSRLCTSGNQTSGLMIYSLTYKSSMLDHHLIEVLLEVGNGRTPSQVFGFFFSARLKMNFARFSWITSVIW